MSGRATDRQNNIVALLNEVVLPTNATVGDDVLVEYYKTEAENFSPNGKKRLYHHLSTLKKELYDDQSASTKLMRDATTPSHLQLFFFEKVTCRVNNDPSLLNNDVFYARRLREKLFLFMEEDYKVLLPNDK